MRQIFKTEMPIYQSKNNFDEEVLFGKIAHHLDSEVRKMLLSGMSGNKASIFHLVSNLLVIEIKILFLTLAH